MLVKWNENASGSVGEFDLFTPAGVLAVERWGFSNLFVWLKLQSSKGQLWMGLDSYNKTHTIVSV